MFDTHILQGLEINIKGEKSLSAEMNFFYSKADVALWRDETSDEKREEIRRSSSSLFQKYPKVFYSPLLLFSTWNGERMHGN